MRTLPLILSLLLALLPAMQAYGKTMGDAHCRTHGHVSSLAPDAAHDPLHAQHHAPDAAAHAHHAGAETKADGAQCECGCLCDVACAGGAALSARFGFSATTPAHEPWLAVTDARHPVAIHDFLLRPPRLS